MKNWKIQTQLQNDFSLSINVCTRKSYTIVQCFRKLCKNNVILRDMANLTEIFIGLHIGLQLHT